MIRTSHSRFSKAEFSGEATSRIHAAAESTEAILHQFADPLDISKTLRSVSHKNEFQNALVCQGPVTNTSLKLLLDTGRQTPEVIHQTFFVGGPDRRCDSSIELEFACSTVFINAILGGFGRRVSENLNSQKLADIANPAAELLDRMVELTCLERVDATDYQDLCDLINSELLARIKYLTKEVTPRVLQQSRFLILIEEEKKTRQFEMLLRRIPLLNQLTDIKVLKPAWDAFCVCIRRLSSNDIVSIMLFFPVLQMIFRTEFEIALRTAGLERIADRVIQGENIDASDLCRPAYAMNPSACRVSVGLEATNNVLRTKEIQMTAFQAIKKVVSELSSEIAGRAWIEQSLSRMTLGKMCGFAWSSAVD